MLPGNQNMDLQMPRGNVDCSCPSSCSVSCVPSGYWVSQLCAGRHSEEMCLAAGEKMYLTSLDSSCLLCIVQAKVHVATGFRMGPSPLPLVARPPLLPLKKEERNTSGFLPSIQGSRNLTAQGPHFKSLQFHPLKRLKKNFLVSPLY